MHSTPYDVGPVSDATTNQVRVEVIARHVPENSRPQQGQWVFQYTVRITNMGEEPVQLLSRHWIITDSWEKIREVKGPGVVGQKPTLAAGESFQYSSWCPLETPTGRMHGTYQMVRADGTQFDVEIAPFALKAPYAVH
ncbi:MAG: Co2+/Mg2+ efflux protein ApaG [Acidobacteria bacterium]|nr:Co2+/Mg2+ efflux protein ApaG [Acidobacteriota bacterium]